MKIGILTIICFFATITYSYSQQGTITINQDENINLLLDLKKDLNKTDTDRYKIQIYNGDRSGAQYAKSEFQSSFSAWSSSVAYEEPNFKTWAGNFKTRLEADRALKKIKNKFPDAFIFKPKKTK